MAMNNEWTFNERPRIVEFILAFCIPIFGILVGIFDLIFYTYIGYVACIFSTLWICIFLYIGYNFIKNSDGWTGSMTNILEYLCATKSIKVVTGPKITIIKGIYAFGNYRVFKKVQFHEGFMLSIAKGQASSLAGRDMNDWSLFASESPDLIDQKLFLTIKTCGKHADANIDIFQIREFFNILNLKTVSFEDKYKRYGFRTYWYLYRESLAKEESPNESLHRTEN